MSAGPRSLGTALQNLFELPTVKDLGSADKLWLKLGPEFSRQTSSALHKIQHSRFASCSVEVKLGCTRSSFDSTFL